MSTRNASALCTWVAGDRSTYISVTFIIHNISLTTSEIVMGKKKAGGGAGLGRALIKERLHTSRGKKKGDVWVRMLNRVYTVQMSVVCRQICE